MARKNPWLADAAIGATGETYEIRTVADFLKVPTERRRICLREFHSWLDIQKSMIDLLCAASDALDGGLKPEHFTWRNEVFRWVDDGKAVMSVTMEPPQSAAAVDPVNRGSSA